MDSLIRSDDHYARDRKIVAMYKAGHIMSDIALESGCSLHTVRRVLNRDWYSHTELMAMQRQKIIELRESGLSTKEIAAEVGCSENHVYLVAPVRRGKSG